MQAGREACVLRRLFGLIVEGVMQAVVLLRGRVVLVGKHRSVQFVHFFAHDREVCPRREQQASAVLAGVLAGLRLLRLEDVGERQAHRPGQDVARRLSGIRVDDALHGHVGGALVQPLIANNAVFHYGRCHL